MAALDAAAAVEEEEFAPVGSGDVSFAESSAGGADGSTLVSKEGNTIIMKGGVCYKIADTADDIPDHYAMGLAWDVTDGKNIDLDASVITLTDKLEEVEIVYFGKLKSKTGSLVHQGDEREGDEDGDDETIKVNLGLVREEVTYLCFVVNSYSGEKLMCVKDCKAHFYNSDTLEESGSFDISDNKAMANTALLMMILCKVGNGTGGYDWYAHAVGEAAEGKTAKENVDEFQDYLKANPLKENIMSHIAEKAEQAAAAAASAATAAKKESAFAKVKLSTAMLAAAKKAQEARMARTADRRKKLGLAAKAANVKVAFETPSGAMQEFEVSAAMIDTLEVEKANGETVFEVLVVDCWVKA